MATNFAIKVDEPSTFFGVQINNDTKGNMFPSRTTDSSNFGTIAYD